MREAAAVSSSPTARHHLLVSSSRTARQYLLILTISGCIHRDSVCISGGQTPHTRNRERIVSRVTQGAGGMRLRLLSKESSVSTSERHRDASQSIQQQSNMIVGTDQNVMR